jgi:hypothetical protein
MADMIEPSLDHHIHAIVPAILPAAKKEGTGEHVADDYDLLPTVRSDVVVKGADIQVLQVDRTGDR